MKPMATSLEQSAVDALDHEPIDWKYKGLPSSWWGQTPAQVCRRRPSLFADGAVSPVATLRTQPLVVVIPNASGTGGGSRVNDLHS